MPTSRENTLPHTMRVKANADCYEPCEIRACVFHKSSISKMKEPPKLTSARIKHARAIEHLEGLQLEFQRFYDSKPYRFTNECDFKTGEKLLVYYPVDIPTSWVAVIGDIFSNLRAALDHAVYELTVWEQSAPLDKTEFPIFEDKTVFSEVKNNGQPTNRSGLYKMRGLSQKTQAVIEAMQPFNIRKQGQIPLLAILHEMNNVDKHREVHLCRRLYQGVNMRMLRDITFVRYPNSPPVPEGLTVFSSFRTLMGNVNLEERAILSRWKPAVLTDEMDVEADIPFEIAFDERSLPGIDVPTPVVPFLTAITEDVANWIYTFAESVK